MDVDSLFKRPGAPASSNKRKLPAPDLDALKRTRIEEIEDEDARLGPAVASVQDFDDDGNPIGQVSRTRVQNIDENGKHVAADEDESFEEKDDRFFGSGLTEEQSKILDIMDGDEGEDEVLDLAQIRKLLLKLERAINKNQDLRMKYANDPPKFVESEADLDSAIKSLMVLTQAPQLYPELVRLGAVPSIVGLLGHENTDIAIDTIELLNEMTDEDVTSGDIEGGAEVDLEKIEQATKSVRAFIDALLEAQILDLLVQNLSRLDEAEDTDKQGVYFTLGIFENFASLDPELSERVVRETPLVKWLLSRLKMKGFDQNKQYASELLAILLQSSTTNRQKFSKEGGVDVVLQSLAAFRKRDPRDADETEYMENLFDALCSALSEVETKQALLDSEGIELMVLMMKQKMIARHRAVKVLDYALGTVSGADNCVRFVDALGLKTLFSAFMSKGVKKHHKTVESNGISAAAAASEEEEHVVGILVSLLNNLPASEDNPARLRLLAKFVENDYEKVNRLMEIHAMQSKRYASTRRAIEKERLELADDDIDTEMEEELYVRQLEGGLFALQQADMVIAWLCAEDDGVRSKVASILEQQGGSLEDVKQVLKDIVSNLGDASTGNQKDIIEALLQEL